MYKSYNHSSLGQKDHVVYFISKSCLIHEEYRERGGESEREGGREEETERERE